MGLALGGCVDDGEDSTTATMMTTSDGVESDSAGEATYGVPLTESGDGTDPFEDSSSTTGFTDTDTDGSSSGSSSGEPDTDTGASSSGTGASSTSG